MLKDLCFEVIQTCPNKCKFCSSESSMDKQKIITLGQFKKTIIHFIKQGGIEEISISGGEPFLHPDLFEMVKFCKDNGIRTTIFTSGIKEVPSMPQEMIEDIKKKCEQDLQEIQEHEPWNERLKRNVKRYYDRWLAPQFEGITSEEYERLKRLELDKIVFDWQALEEKVYIECLECSGVKNISILNFVPQGRGKDNKDELMLSNEELKEFSEILKREKQHYSGNIRIGIPLNGKISHLCTAGTEKLDIMYDGTIVPCPAFKEISIETMEKYGIKLHSIYEDLEKVVVHNGKRKEPLCKQIYRFSGDLTESDEKEI